MMSHAATTLTMASIIEDQAFPMGSLMQWPT